jgi:hypothetical protein
LSCRLLSRDLAFIRGGTTAPIRERQIITNRRGEVWP